METLVSHASLSTIVDTPAPAKGLGGRLRRLSVTIGNVITNQHEKHRQQELQDTEALERRAFRRAPTLTPLQVAATAPQGTFLVRAAASDTFARSTQAPGARAR